MATLVSGRLGLLGMAVTVAKDYFRPLVNIVSYVSGSESKAEAPASTYPQPVHSHADVERDLRAALLHSTRVDLQLVSKLRLPAELQPAVLVEGNHLSATATSIGFGNIELVAKRLLETHADLDPYLFGVNRGGSILANLLSQRLNLHQKHLVRCDFRSDWRKVMCEPRPNVELAIVIDDAVRSGETLREVRRHLISLYPNAKLYALALVVAVEDGEEDKNSEKLFHLVDYYPWISAERKTSLPWTGKQSDDAATYIEEEGVNQALARVLTFDPAFTRSGRRKRDT